jgi:hypothetical protein
MRVCFRRWSSANMMAFALLCSSPGEAQSMSPPPLQANEAVVKTKDGCGFVVAADTAKYVEKSYAAHVWGGACVEGLAMGQGQDMNGWMYWGRPFGYWSFAHDSKSRVVFHWQGKSVEINTPADVSAHWPAEQKKWDDTPVVYRMFRDLDGNLVYSQKLSCILADASVLARSLRDCSIKKPYGIFQVSTNHPENVGAKSKRVLCPDPRTPKGCEVLWQQMAGPLFERSQKFVAENAPKAEALQREMPSLIAAAEAEALAAAREKEAGEQRLAAAAAAEAARVAELKAAEERKFQHSLARGNPGQLFALADQLSAEGNTDQAREVRRALISRFPDHALAATAAAQLAGGGSTAGKSTATASAMSSRTDTRARYASVCDRNWAKILNGVRARAIAQSGYNDLWIRDFNWYSAKVFEPCIGTSPDSASAYQHAMKEYNRINNFCAGPHDEWECLQWGTSGGISDNGGHPYNNPAYYAGWKADVDRALSDPDYSADLGTASGTGAVNTADAACAASLKSIKNQFDAAQKLIPENSVVVRSEAILWMITESVARIEAQCPQSTHYRAQSQQFVATREATQRACDGMSSRGACVARLPEREPVSASLQPTADKKPLPQAPQASCDEGGGANWLKCKREACSRMEGKLETGKGACVTCYAPGGNANWCPTGSGYNSAQ